MIYCHFARSRQRARIKKQIKCTFGKDLKVELTRTNVFKLRQTLLPNQTDKANGLEDKNQTQNWQLFLYDICLEVCSGFDNAYVLQIYTCFCQIESVGRMSWKAYFLEQKMNSDFQNKLLDLLLKYVDKPILLKIMNSANMTFLT